MNLQQRTGLTAKWTSVVFWLFIKISFTGQTGFLRLSTSLYSLFTIKFHNIIDRPNRNSRRMPFVYTHAKLQKCQAHLGDVCLQRRRGQFAVGGVWSTVDCSTGLPVYARSCVALCCISALLLLNWSTMDLQTNDANHHSVSITNYVHRTSFAIRGSTNTRWSVCRRSILQPNTDNAGWRNCRSSFHSPFRSHLPVSLPWRTAWLVGTSPDWQQVEDA